MTHTVPLCIWHYACDDGFASAWVVNRALGGQVAFHPGVYGEDPPDVTGRDVVLVDFSYKRDVMTMMRHKARSLLVLDHHKTAQAEMVAGNHEGCQFVDLATYTAPVFWQRHLENAYQDECENARPIYTLFDMNECGASLTWRFFFPNTALPPFLAYIKDRDLWLKQLPAGDEFTIALRSYPQDCATWDTLFERGVAKLQAEGHSIQRYYRARIEELKRSAYPATLAGHKIMIANAPYFAASEVAGELCAADGVDFGACYFEAAPGKFQYSLRSRGDFDVSEVAKKFGGGGHKNAAGFTVDGTPAHTHIGVGAVREEFAGRPKVKKGA